MRPLLLTMTLFLLLNGFTAKAAPHDSYTAIDSLWKELMLMDGCLVGAQNVVNGKISPEQSVMSRSPQWTYFFSLPKDSLVRFLLGQLPDTAASHIHTCPCYAALKGEMAVYSLQFITLKNWFELKEFNSFGKKESRGCSESYQAWLWEIIRDKKQAKVLQKAWTNYYEQAAKK